MLALGTPSDDEGHWFTTPNEEKLNVWQKGGELEEASVDLITDGSFQKVIYIPQDRTLMVWGEGRNTR